ncbi:phage major tail tube protein [Govanella unica]|uniref:Phage major tail tube protein n=1 Tax=Govanella unica TaxID=2975056 RepID=A0A9X3TW35_9PROT|nr:phage major tail tube protein [Govania unica]MDA5192790.1 phage major tail tube protein [Govania unica]
MGLPRTLKNMTIFNEGLAYLGEVSSVTLPKLTRKLEEWRGGGMGGPVKLDMGQEALELEMTFGGPMRDILRQYGVVGMAGVYLRFVGVYQRDDSSSMDNIEIIIRGRHEEIDMGEAKPGEISEFKVKTAVAYYKLVWGGVTEIEIDHINMVEIVSGVDRLAKQRGALGIF